MKLRHVCRTCALVVLVGCSDWSQVKNAHDVEGQLVRVEPKDGQETTVDEVVLCDTEGNVIAGDSRDCSDPSAPKFDVRRDKVLKHDRDSKATVGIVVTGILTGIFVPAAYIGSQVLAHK